LNQSRGLTMTKNGERMEVIIVAEGRWAGTTI
jgi:hypothetical protein